MRIRTSLFLLSLFSICLIIILGLIVSFSFYRINEGLNKISKMRLVRTAIFNLNSVLYEDMMYQIDRAHQQVQVCYNTLGRLLEELKKDKSVYLRNSSVIDTMVSNYNFFGDLHLQIDSLAAKRKRLDELAAMYAKRMEIVDKDRVQSEIVFCQHTEERLAGQILTRSHKINSLASELITSIEKDIIRVQKRANLLVRFAILGFIIFSSLASFLVMHTISQPVAELVKGARIFGRGDLDKRIVLKTKNELGFLGDTFNQMAKGLKEFQDKLIRSERLAALGKLSGAVGHELRNPLGVIRNSIYFLRMKLGPEQKDEKVKKHLDILESEITTSDRIITNILSFGRVKEPQLSKANIYNVIQESLGKLSMPEDIEVINELKAGLPQIQADAGQLTHVFSNLMVNAIQAMSTGGKLTIAGYKQDDFIEIDIIDTGEGIPEENLDKIFESLFSTWPQGTGLGLTVCQNIIEKHGGSIEVESEVGKGTRVRVKLPIREEG